MGYVDVDPVVREGFRRSLPFRWSELTIQTAAEASFLADALAHGVGPHGFSIPVQTKHGHRGLFSISSSCSEQEWADVSDDDSVDVNPDCEPASSPSYHRGIRREIPPP